MRDLRVNARDAAEIARSAAEAQNFEFKRAEVERYLNPPEDTPYSLEFAFHLLGDIRGKKVLDLGCGTGENLIPLLRRGAHVIGIDISPELIALAEKRLDEEGLQASLKVASASDTGLSDESVDAVFAMSVLHHLELEAARREIQRILRHGGYLILREPVRYSLGYSVLVKLIRQLVPAREPVSEYEHPLSLKEVASISAGFEALASRYFRLPFIPVLQRIWASPIPNGFRVDRWLLRTWPSLSHFATVRVMKLRKT